MNKQITEHFSFDGDPKLLCRCCGRIKLEDIFWETMQLVETLRSQTGPLIVNCGYRCPEHNESIGGAEKSLHLDFAIDLRSISMPLTDAHQIAVDLGFGGIGLYSSFIHLDRRDLLDRPEARWDQS